MNMPGKKLLSPLPATGKTAGSEAGVTLDFRLVTWLNAWFSTLNAH